MKAAALLLPLLLLPLTTQAEKGQSIMFGDQDPMAGATSKKDPAREKADYCNQLRTQLDELKGKPQRRNVMLQQYQLECQQQ